MVAILDRIRPSNHQINQMIVRLQINPTQAIRQVLVLIQLTRLSPIKYKTPCPPRQVNLVGMESPALTSAVAIARYVIGMMQEREPFEENDQFNPYHKSIRRFADMTLEEQAQAIRENPAYGELICRCQKVTRAELLQAVRNPMGVRTVTGMKYRTRSMMGRCQGGYCQMRITRMLEEELGIPAEKITYARPGSNLFFGKVRE